MAFTGNFMCTSFKVQLMTGTHNFTTGTGNTFKLALYDNSASFTAATTAYTATNEVTASGTYSVGTFSYSYTMTIDPVMSPGYYFSNYASQFGGSNTSTKSGTKTLQVPTYALATTGVVSAIMAPASGVSNVVSTAINYGPLTYNGAIIVTNGYFDTWSDSVTQAVPGPLPILGASVAFGFSRKLRFRIKKAIG
jgi:hypothetical protein